MAKQDDAMSRLVKHYTKLGEQERHEREVESRVTLEQREFYGYNTGQQWSHLKSRKGGSQGSY